MCADALRSRTRQRRLSHAVATISGDRGQPDHSAHVALSGLVAGLDPDRRTAFVLTRIIGLSYAQAAQVCGCPIGTIRSRVTRARTDLLDMLTDDEGHAAALLAASTDRTH